MAALEYSREALNALGKFYRTNVMVFVEGDYDIPFWRAVFNELAEVEFAIDSVGGKKELEKLAQRIVDEDVQLIVARDADYSRVIEGGLRHERVITTLGYSIENSLYTPAIVRKVAALAHKKFAPLEDVVAQWMADLVDALKPLVVGDIASEMYGLGVSSLGSHCEPYMYGRSSYKPSKAKITAKIEEVSRKVSHEHRRQAEEEIERAGGYGAHLLRGHVLASAVLRFIAWHARGKAVQKEAIYGVAITALERHLGEAGHPHTEHYRKEVSAAIRSLKRVA